MMYFILWVVFLLAIVLAVPIASMMEKRKRQAAYAPQPDEFGEEEIAGEEALGEEQPAEEAGEAEASEGEEAAEIEEVP